jgi:hypothetical protein
MGIFGFLTKPCTILLLGSGLIGIGGVEEKG